jgi:hypothetical protein
VKATFAALVAAALAVAGPPTARAETFCVGTEVSGCEARSTVRAAFDAAAASDGSDTILIGRRTETGTFADQAGEPVHVVGAGRAATVLSGSLDLAQAGSSVAALTARAPVALSGAGGDLRLEGAVRLRDRATLVSSSVSGSVTTAGDVRMESVAIAGAGVDVGSGQLVGRHLTVYGSAAAGVRIAAAASARVSDSIVWGFARGFAGSAAVTTSDYPEGAGAVDPAFAAPPGDLRLRADSALVDAGDPAPLARAEPHEDALGDVRAVDGNGDGTARRDIGALERRPPAPPSADGNRLANPGAEQGPAANGDAAGPRPPAWGRTGGFTSVRYGAVGAGNAPFLSLSAAEALGAGDAFFAAGPAGAASLTQVVDVSTAAPEIDGGAGAVSLSALLGGYRESPDAATVAAEFRDPFGERIGALALDTITPAERANATMLAARAADGVIPPLTRTIAVTVRAGAPGGSYNDAYADDLALIPRIGALPGMPPNGHPARAKPYTGVVVTSRRVLVDRRGRAGVRLACASRTVGRCRGVITLTRSRSAVIGSKRFTVRRGRVARVRVRLPRSVRRVLRKEKRLKGHAYAASRDGQGLTRTTIAPVRLVRRR